jgi:hypothetical protein
MDTVLPAYTTYSLVIALFAFLLVACYVLYLGVRNSETDKGQIIIKTTLISAFLATWALVAFALGINRFFLAVPSETRGFPTIAYALLPFAIGISWLILSRAFRRIIDAIPQHWIMGIQLVRVFGLFFVLSYLQGFVQGEFAIPAGVGDALIGITAPIVVYLYLNHPKKARNIAVLWNILGVADLTIAVTLGALAVRGVFPPLSLDIPNQLTDFPLILIPLFGVPLPILLHIFSLRALLKNRENVDMA